MRVGWRLQALSAAMNTSQPISRIGLLCRLHKGLILAPIGIELRTVARTR
jgi:hypothetical protein